MKAGDNVVCIEDTWHHIGYGDNGGGPKIGDIVTVSRIMEKYGYVYLFFHEWPRNSHGPDPGYNSVAFRPVDYAYGKEVCEAIETEFKELKQPALV